MADAQTIIQSELQPGETLIWVDQPGPSAVARAWLKIGLMVGIFPLIFGFISFLFWALGAFGYWSVLFNILTLLSFGGMMLPFWMKIFAHRIFYGVTNRRTLIVSTWPWHKAHSFYAKDLSSLERKWMHNDERGTLIFARRPPIGDDTPELRPDWGFYGIDNVRQVEEIVENLK